MATVKIVNTQGQEAGDLELLDEVFGRTGGEHLVHQAMVIAQAHARALGGHSKTRAEVRGGGKKPWRQKGTGRARHGSIRSPIWKGGGVVWGPNGRRFDHKMNKKAKHAAMSYALSARLSDGELRGLEAVDLAGPKTKEFVGILQRLGVEKKKTLLLLAAQDEGVQRASNNLRNVAVRVAPAVSILDVLWADEILGTPDALQRMQENLAK
ncbi:MAG TPA: 50S ribosomal protein L4 [Armatimonadota bacterium]